MKQQTLAMAADSQSGYEQYRHSIFGNPGGSGRFAGMTDEMGKTWGASSFGKLFTRAPDWRLILKGEQFTLMVNESSLSGSVSELADVTVKRGVIWAR